MLLGSVLKLSYIYAFASISHIGVYVSDVRS